MKYMIHACLQREWYVNDYLIPSMLAQGIKKKDIELWLDSNGDGCLQSFFKSMKHCGEDYDPDGGVWHIQDDVVLSKTFYEKTKQYDYGVAYGFCNNDFDGGNVNRFGRVPQQFQWNSFQCVRIPNSYAKESADWFFNDV